MITDFLLSIVAKIFEALKKKSKNIYWQNTELANVRNVKIAIVEKILNQKMIIEKLSRDEIKELREVIYKNEGLK